MPRTTLLLYTYAFPYGHTETFLETEIHYLKAEFNRIFIMPASRPSGIREIPDGIVVIDDLAVRSRNSRFSRAAGGLFRSIFDSGFWTEITDKPGLLAKRISLYRLLNMQDGARHTYKVTKSILDKYTIDTSRAVAYSYWLDFFSLGFSRADFKNNGMRCVSRGHGYDIYEFLYDPPHIPYQHTNLKSLDLMVFISKHGMNHITARYPFMAGKSIVSRLGVHDPGFINSGTATGVLHVVSCSGIVPVKRTGLLIDGLACLAGKHPELTIKWTHIGDGPLKNQIIDKCRDRLSGYVEYAFTGQMSNKDVINFYETNQVDILVNVSRSEGIPVTMMEAQSCGIPVCGTAVGGVPEIISEENGHLFPSDPTPEDIAEYLALFSDPEYRKNKATLSRLNWENNFNAEKNYRDFAGMLRNL